jgi:hypothetical protein
VRIPSRTEVGERRFWCSAGVISYVIDAPEAWRRCREGGLCGWRGKGQGKLKGLSVGL